MRQTHLDVEAAVGVSQGLDVVGGAGDGLGGRGEKAGASIGVADGSRETPVADLGDQGTSFFSLEQPRVGGVVEERAAVVTEAHAVGELTREGSSVDLVVDDSGTLPDAHQPRERDEVGGEIGRDLDHDALSAGRGRGS